MPDSNSQVAKRVEHTPGPWKVGVPYDCLIPIEWLNSEPGRPGELSEVATVAHFDGFPPGERGEANARLIAAAPELLEVVETLLDACRPGKMDETGFGVIDISRCLARAEAAIAKARGQ